MSRHATPDAKDLRRLWELDQHLDFLNHGSFGACPIPVLHAQNDYRRRMERNPVEFLDRELPRMLEATRRILASALGGDPDQLVLVPNATTGINALLMSAEVKEGDDILMTDFTYRACAKAILHVAGQRGATATAAPIPVPAARPSDIVEAVVGSVSPRTRLAIIDHVTSPTATILPIRQIAAELDALGVRTIVDGAHGPGMLDLQLDQLGVWAYVGNCHKWLLTPKGAGFIYASSELFPYLVPTVISHGWSPAPPSADRTHAMFRWTGTTDPSPFLAIGDALRFINDTFGGVTDLTVRNRNLALEAASLLQSRVGLRPCAPTEMIGSMVSFELAPARSHTDPSPWPDPLQRDLFVSHGIEIPVIPWEPTQQRFLRISAQAYNSIDQYERLADALISSGAN